MGNGIFSDKISEILDVLVFLNADVISKNNNFSKDGIPCYGVKVKINGKTKKAHFVTIVLKPAIYLLQSN